jgi:uncharacterized delta-60 repeat protein
MFSTDFLSLNGTDTSQASSDPLYIGGSFTTYKGVTQNYVVKLNYDGSNDTNFNVGTKLNNSVNVVRVDENGKIYLGGEFTSYDGIAANRIIRLNPDGTKDSSFDNSTGFNGVVKDIQITADGIYVGGAFTTYKGVAANRLIRLNPDGSKDTGFNNTTGFDQGQVNKMAISGTDIFCVGVFDRWKGALASSAAKISNIGDLIVAFDSNPGGNVIPITDIALLSSGQLYISGPGAAGWDVSGSAQVARLNSNGTFDGTFFPGYLDPTGGIFITIDSANKVYAVGNFISIGLNTQTRLVRFNTNATIDAGFDIGAPGPNQGLNNSALAVYLLHDKIFIGGSFTTYKNVTSNRIVILNTDGSVYSAFNIGTGFNGDVKFIGK